MLIPSKIKKEYREKLEQLQNYTFDKSLFIDDYLLTTISEITSKTGYEVALLISRKGQVLDVSVGDKTSAQMAVEDVKDGYLGVRIIHTHPIGSSKLSNLDLSFLKNKKLDCMCAISIKDESAYDAQIAYLTGESVTVVNCHDARYINKYGLVEKIFESEKLYKEYYDSVYRKQNQRAVLVKVAIKDKKNIESDLEELESLARTAGIVCVDKISQFRATPDGKYYIGSGKIDLLKEVIQLYEANLVIFDNELNGSKINAISNTLGVKVIDRSMLILDIFASRAMSNEGKLQVELAQLKYSLPRLNALNANADRYSGGVGMRGPGESKLELNRRVVEQNIVKKSEELKKLQKHRLLNRQNRKQNSKPIVAIVGYTNSGKSTLLNLLAKSDVYVKDELFATLDTTTRKVWMGDGKQVLFTDTVGFINNLPHEFIDAFASTLEESVDANLILHVVDISDPNYKMHIDVTNNVLKRLNTTAPVMVVYNKCDMVKLSEFDIDDDSVYISAKDNRGIVELKQKIVDRVFSS